MKAKLFGTDGVRGRANSEPTTAETAMRLGQAAGLLFRHGDDAGRAVIGKDTRLSCYMLESALTAGFASVGVETILLGPVPTPAVGMLTRSLRADLGVMISASHNPAEDNGLKFFGGDGFKLSDGEEQAIEYLLSKPAQTAEAARIGRARRIDGAAERYVEFAKASFPKNLSLEGLRVVVDCAHGAAYRSAPCAIWELGAEVIEIGVAPDGLNINEGCGSTAPEACRRAVLENRADLGVSLDGDGDRVHLIDETGAIVDGDQLLALIADEFATENRLRGGALVATVMSNLGLERHLAGRGVGLRRTAVGDRNVIELMRAEGYNLGGEQSGHIILSDYATTGDGLLAALRALAAIARQGRPASKSLRLFEPVPQTLRNVRVGGAAAVLAGETAKRAIAAASARLGEGGRVLVRPSGTEPLIRVMVEGDDDALVPEVADDLAATLTAAATESAALEMAAE